MAMAGRQRSGNVSHNDGLAAIAGSADVQVQYSVWSVVVHDPAQVAGNLSQVAVGLVDDVADLQTGTLCGSAGIDLHHLHAPPIRIGHRLLLDAKNEPLCPRLAGRGVSQLHGRRTARRREEGRVNELLVFRTGIRIFIGVVVARISVGVVARISVGVVVRIPVAIATQEESRKEATSSMVKYVSTAAELPSAKMTAVKTSAEVAP